MKEYKVKVFEGRVEWYFEGKLHREDGPAIEWRNGSKIWYKKGLLHREDGPACEYADGTKEWYLNGHLHREGGPAVEFANGTKYWYKNGKKLTEEEFNIKTNKSVYEGKTIEIDNVKYKLVKV